MTVMEAQDAQILLQQFLHDVSVQFQRVPGSAIIVRYIKSSYQNDPVRSAVELFLFLFAVRYLLAPKYSTQKQNYVRLSDQVRAEAEKRFERTGLKNNRRLMI